MIIDDIKFVFQNFDILLQQNTIGQPKMECGVLLDSILERCGCGIDAANSIGSSLFSEILLTGHPVNPLFLNKVLETAGLGYKVKSFSETSSTNDIAWDYCNGANERIIITAETQRAGRGRFSDRKWHDVPGSSLLFSVLFSGDSVEQDVLSIAAGVAVAETINEFCNIEAKVKWPNDVLISGKKVSGMMVEARAVYNKPWYVLGIGVNCNQKSGDLHSEIDNKAVSLFQVYGKYIERSMLLFGIVHKLDALIKDVGRQELAERWKSLCDLKQQKIELAHNGSVIPGTVIDIDPFAGIMLKLEGGEQKFFSANTSSVVRVLS